MILRAVEDDNTKLDKRDRVTIDSIRNRPRGTSRSRTSLGVQGPHDSYPAHRRGNHHHPFKGRRGAH
jgi:hypothetical protein